eukprot:13665-Amorphochlora_amoeboformis.AAC.1
MPRARHSSVFFQPREEPSRAGIFRGFPGIIVGKFFESRESTGEILGVSLTSQTSLRIAADERRPYRGSAPCIFHVVFCAGRSLEAYAVFVAAAFFTEVRPKIQMYPHCKTPDMCIRRQYNAPVVLTSFFVTLGAGVLLSLLHDTSGVIRRIRNHKFRIVMDSVLRSNSTLCYLAGLKFCGPYR